MDPNWLTGIGTSVLALATVILAGVTVWSVRKNNEANRLLREETERLQRQERERLGKLQTLDLISTWADEADRIIGDKMFSLQATGPINEFLNRTQSIRTDWEAIKDASQLFNGEFQTVIIEALNKLNVFIKSVFALRDLYMKNLNEDKDKLKQTLIDARIASLNSIIKLQAYVRKHRISLLL